MKEVINDLLTSKKAVAAAGAGLAYLLVRLAGHWGLAIDDATAAQVGDRLVALAVFYLGAQGLHDHGAEAEQIRQDAPVKTFTAVSGPTMTIGDV